MRQGVKRVMKIVNVHCLFEQSGTFKNEFKKLGYHAEDYDILNDFGETDNVVDLFAEIEKAYAGKQSIFDNFTSEDLILAFFPCTRFENQINLFYRGDGFQMRNWSDKQKLDYVYKLRQELNLFYELFYKMYLVCLQKGLRMIIENPWSESHYLVRYFPIKASLIDNYRRKRGDYYKKPTQYWFVNCKPENKMLYEATFSQKETKRINYVSNKVERSMISKEYANRFIREFILD